MLPMFAGRMFPFDLTCTTAYAELLAKVREAGSGIETADACIAAVTIANGRVLRRGTATHFGWPVWWSSIHEKRSEGAVASAEP